MSSHESSDSLEAVTGGHAESMELAEVIEEMIVQVTGEGITGNEARHAVIERVIERIGDPSRHALVAGHVHARMDLG
jgi:hypothetical protein